MSQSEREPSIGEILDEKMPKEQKKKYNTYVDSMTPKHNGFINFINAFWTGGLICVLGQILQNIYKYYGVAEKDASLYTTVTLVACSVILTGFNLYSKMAKVAGAGTIVPITGFANSVAAPAIDYKAEGQVFGIGCKIFTIAGPVILYGVFSSWVLGLLYWIWTLF